ncbi:MAG TPA: hypothetical protein VM557_09345 [Thermoanaerobaculia bacterium]|nr:hypothetical protein [Thermoanaerobaculia bacterium]
MRSRTAAYILLLATVTMTSALGQTTPELAIAAPATDTAQTVATPPPGVARTATSVEADPTIARALESLLRVHPGAVGAVIDLDPSLLANEEFLARHPEIQAFIAANPEVARNPRLYLRMVHVRGVSHSSPLESILEGVTIFSVMLLIFFAVTWLIRTIIEERRWSRTSKIQNDVHSKLLDRFTANEQLLQYIQSPAGKRFLESAPIAVETATRAASPSAPITRMFWSIQIGIVVAAGSLGMLMVSGRFDQEANEALLGMGVIGLCVGIGFALAGTVSFILSRRLGLWPEAGSGRNTSE